jgi:hypothetical protein
MAKVLTIRQPWASAIIWASKDVENRTWPTRYRGRLYIHAGQQLESADVLLANVPVPRGAIIGYVTLVDVMTGSLSRWAEPGQWHWLLAHPLALPDPVPARGRLGLWQLDDETARAVGETVR